MKPSTSAGWNRRSATRVAARLVKPSSGMAPESHPGECPAAGSDLGASGNGDIEPRGCASWAAASLRLLLSCSWLAGYGSNLHVLIGPRCEGNINRPLHPARGVRRDDILRELDALLMKAAAEVVTWILRAANGYFLLYFQGPHLATAAHFLQMPRTRHSNCIDRQPFVGRKLSGRYSNGESSFGPVELQGFTDLGHRGGLAYSLQAQRPVRRRRCEHNCGEQQHALEVEQFREPAVQRPRAA